MSVPYYPGSLYTPNLSLALYSIDSEIAENFVILDSAFGSGSSINVNGTLVASPNLNGTTPAAPGGDTNVTFQVDINGNVSAYVPTAASTPAGLDTQVQFNNGGVFGASSNFVFNSTGPQTTWNNILNVANGGTVTIGRSSGGSEQPLEIHTAFSNGEAIYTHSDTAFRAPTLGFARSNGTQASPTAVTGAGELGYITFSGYDGSAYAEGAQIVCQTGTAWSTGIHSSTVYINAVPAQSTTPAQVFRFNSNTDNGGDYNCNASSLNLSIGGNSMLNFTTALSGYEGYRDCGISRVTSASMAMGTGVPVNAAATVSMGMLLANYAVFSSIAASGAPTITTGGAAGTTTWTYVLVAKDAAGNNIASASGSTTTGNATLNATNFNVITVSSPSVGAVSYDIYRTAVGTSPVTTGKIGVISTAVIAGENSNVLNDTGLPGNGSAVPANAVTSGIKNSGTYTDSTGAVGTSGQLLSSTVTGTAWVPAPTGFVNPMTTLGDIIYENATPAATRLAGNTTTAKEYLSQTGNGTISAAPAWAQIAVTDLANIAGGTVLGNTGTTAGAVAATIAPVLGIPGTSTGSIAIASSTASGKYTITVPANAATPTLTLPTTSNVLAGQFAGDNVLYSNTPVGATAAGTLALPTLSTQTANFVFAGPTSGAAAAPTFRALVAADIPNAANLPLWSNLQNAAGALTLANGSNATTFNQTSAVAWLWANTTTATSGTTNASPLLELAANYWTGAASAADTWTIGSSLAAGTNGASTLTFTHTGSTGVATVTLPRVGLTNVGTLTTIPSVFDNAVPTTGIGFASGQISFMDTTSAFLYSARGFLLTPAAAVIGWTTNTNAAGTQDTGISRLGAASLAIGNGTASDTTGNLSFNKVIKYAGVATVSQGVPAEYAVSDLTAQSAAITATTLYATTATGMYRVSWSATITTADGVSSVLGGAGGFQVLYTSPTDSVVKTTVSGNSVTSAANTTGTAVGGCEVVYAKTGTNIQFQYGYTSATPGQMVFEIHIKVEAM